MHNPIIKVDLDLFPQNEYKYKTCQVLMPAVWKVSTWLNTLGAGHTTYEFIIELNFCPSRYTFIGPKELKSQES
jgi:hypothetical protein